MFIKALNYGVNEYDYWNESDPITFWCYREAFIEKEANDLKFHNHLAWLSGVYQQSAVASVLSSKNKYFSEPIPMITSVADMIQKEKTESIRLRNNIDNQMLRVMGILNKQKNEEEEIKKIKEQ